MKILFSFIIFLLCFFSCSNIPRERNDKRQTADMEKLGYVWMMPKKETFTEFMTNLDQWPQTLKIIDILGYADHRLHKDHSEAELRDGFAVMNMINLPLALEVGAVKEWAAAGAGTFYAQRGMWNDFINWGASISGIVLDEPLVNVMNYPDIYKPVAGNTNEQLFQYAVKETAEFIKLVREDYPDWFIADIEAFPFFSADYIIHWIDVLETKLKAINVRGQDFFRLDVDWNAFPGKRLTWTQGWLEVKRIEDHCRKIGLPFSVVYWGADIPGSQNLINDPASWFTSTMKMGQGYFDAKGKPDQYVIQTWVEVDINGVKEGLPLKTLPETDPESFTYTLVEFNKRFIPEK